MADPTFQAAPTGTPFNPFGLSDVGIYAKPTFADIDGDDDLDAFVGNYDGDTLYFENLTITTSGTGTPAFATASSNHFGLGNVVLTASPAFADIDHDGDLDAFIGNGNGDTLYYENEGSVSSPNFATTAVTNPFGLSNVEGFAASPTFADIDKDGDLDAFIGSYGGDTLFFRNTATAGATTPVFTLETGSIGLIDVGDNAKPTFVDIDGDDDLDAFIGNNAGETWFFRNNAATGLNVDPVFVASATDTTNGPFNPFGLTNVGFNASPAFADIDSDGDLDAFIGNDSGETLYFLNGPTNASPIIGGLTTTTTINDTATATPFSGVTITDTDNVTVSVTLDFAPKGVFTTESLSASGFTSAGGGVYNLASTTAASAQTAIRQLVFNPADNRVAPAATELITFTISVNDGVNTPVTNYTTTVTSTSVNDAPTDTALSNATVSVYDGANATVGTLSSTDADTGDTFTYSLVSGDGSTDNGLFNFSGNTLRATDAATLPAGTYQVRVRTTDAGSQTFEEAYTITASDALTVTTNSDSGANATTGGTYTAELADGGGLSLREALALASAGNKTIGFAPGAFTTQNLSLGSDATVPAGSTFDSTGLNSLGIVNSSLILSGSLAVHNAASDSIYIASTLSGSGNLSKSGAGQLTLASSANFTSHTGTTTVDGGTLQIGSDAALGSGALTLNGGTLLLSNVNGTVDNAITLSASGGTVDVLTTPATLSGVISGTGVLTMNGSQVLTLSGANTYSGGTLVGGFGGISITDGSNIGSGAVTFSSLTNLTITGADVTLANGFVLNANGTINNANAVTLSGVLSGANTNSFTKTGAGTLTLSGTNTYSGSTAVTGGTLSVTGSLASTSNLTVNSDATLTGSGSVGTASSAGQVIFNGPGSLAPGVNGPGTLTLNNGLSMTTGVTVAMQINGATPGAGYDQLVVNGVVNLGNATLSVSLGSGYTPGSTDSFTLIDNDGIDPVEDGFSGLGEGATITLGSTNYIISYSGGTGNDVVLSLPIIRPTLTAFTDGEGLTALEDTQQEITLANLLVRGDAADSDGTVDAFVVQELTTGTLKIGTSAGDATAWDATTNNTIDATHHAYWTPDGNAISYQDAFTVTAKDNVGAQSAPAVRVTVNVTAVNDAPLLSATGLSPTFTEDSDDPVHVTLFNSANVSTVESGQTLIGLTLTVTNVTDVTDDSYEALKIGDSTVQLDDGSSGDIYLNNSPAMQYLVSVTTGTATVTLTKPEGILADTMAGLVDGIKNLSVNNVSA